MAILLQVLHRQRIGESLVRLGDLLERSLASSRLVRVVKERHLLVSTLHDGDVGAGGDLENVERVENASGGGLDGAHDEAVTESDDDSDEGLDGEGFGLESVNPSGGRVEARDEAEDGEDGETSEECSHWHQVEGRFGIGKFGHGNEEEEEEEGEKEEEEEERKRTEE